MTNSDRFIVALAVFSASTSTGDGVASIARWMGASDVVAAVMFFAMTIGAHFVFVGAIQAYGRHGWRGKR